MSTTELGERCLLKSNVFKRSCSAFFHQSPRFPWPWFSESVDYLPPLLLAIMPCLFERVVHTIPFSRHLLFDVRCWLTKNGPWSSFHSLAVSLISVASFLKDWGICTVLPVGNLINVTSFPEIVSKIPPSGKCHERGFSMDVWTHYKLTIIIMCLWRDENCSGMVMSPVHQVWPKPSCKAQWKEEEDKAERGRGGKTTSGNGQAWSSPSPRRQWRTGKNGGSWLRNYLWCPNDPRG